MKFLFTGKESFFLKSIVVDLNSKQIDFSFSNGQLHLKNKIFYDLYNILLKILTKRG